LVNLIILASKGIDIILGIDWLRKWDGVILCAKRAIRLPKEDGTIVVTPCVSNPNDYINHMFKRP
jgi:hypothetical protein